MLRYLWDEHLQMLADICRHWLSGEEMTCLYWGDFYALPNKVPEGPMANACPLLTFHTLWKVFSTMLKQHLSERLCEAELIPKTPFALRGKSSATDLIPVLHDFILDCWFHGKCAYTVMDDIRHAFGSAQHQTLHNVLTLARFHSNWIHIIMGAAMHSVLHMGGSKGIKLALSNFRAGITQGCPISALIFCLLIELRISIILDGIPLPQSPGGQFARFAYMDDTMFVLENLEHMQCLVDQQQLAGI